MKQNSFYAQELTHILFTTDRNQQIVDSNKYVHLDSLHVALNEVVKKYHLQGYLVAGVDSIVNINDTIKSYLFIGKQYEWHDLDLTLLPSDLKSTIFRDFGTLKNKKVNLAELQSLLHHIYTYAERLHHPFATIFFDSISIYDNSIVARVNYDPGQKAVIDSIAVHYSDYLSKKFIRNYFGLYDSMDYDITVYEKINQKINSLPFVRASQPWDIYFGIENNVFNLYLSEKKSNQANAIFGLQPSPSEEGKYMITADVLFKVYNTFGNGDMLHITYQQFQDNSPKLFAAIEWPYILNTKWGIDARFDFMKYDTLFRKTLFHVDFKYLSSEQNNFSIFYENESSRIIHFDTQFTKINKKLPPQLDVTKQGIGLGFEYGVLDNVLMPRRGISFQLSGIAYNKKVIKNTAIDVISDKDIFDYNSLYDSFTQAQFQFNIKSNIEFYRTFFNSITLLLRNNNGYMLSQKGLYMNEMYTLGGHKLLRGFNELSVFSSQYALFSIEPRIYIGENSYFNVFSDIAYLKAHYNDYQSEYKWMTSVGLGAQLNTEGGLFNITFALGKDGKMPMSRLKDMRVHLGYSIYF